MTGLPEPAKLIEHEGGETGAHIRQEVPERIQLFLHPDGRSLLLLEAVAQEMEFILEIGIALLQARAILEELHEPLFFRAHRTPLGPSLEKAQLVDQIPASRSAGGTRRPRSKTM